jgi:hypothetical protein
VEVEKYKQMHRKLIKEGNHIYVETKQKLSPDVCKTPTRPRTTEGNRFRRSLTSPKNEKPSPSVRSLKFTPAMRYSSTYNRTIGDTKGKTQDFNKLRVDKQVLESHH